MKIKRTELLNGVKRVSTAVTASNILPVYEQILFEADGEKLMLTVLSSDSIMNVELPIEKTDKIVFSMKAKHISDILDKITADEVIFEKNDNKLKIKAGKFKGNYETLSIEDFPQRMKIEAVVSKYKFNLSQLVEAIRISSFCCAKESHNQVLQMVCLDIKKDKYVFVGTDGKRMTASNIESNNQGEFQILLPSIMNILKSGFSDFEEIELCYDGSRIKFASGNVEYMVMLSTLKYPNYAKVIPEEDNYSSIFVSKSLLKNSIELVTIRDSQVSDVMLSAEGNVLAVSKVDDKVVVSDDQLECKYSGEKKSICLNSEFVKQLLKTSEDDEIEMKIKDEKSPVVFKGKNFIHIIMPIFVK